MRKVLVIAAIIFLVFLAACGETQRAKPLKQSPTAAVVAAPQPEAPVADAAPTKTAAEAIKELQIEQVQTESGPKSATTGMPPAPAGLTGQDAMKARMKALYSQSQEVENIGDVDTDFGSRFDDLPDDYGNDGSAGE
jgi:hypothetical protein